MRRLRFALVIALVAGACTSDGPSITSPSDRSTPPSEAVPSSGARTGESSTVPPEQAGKRSLPKDDPRGSVGSQIDSIAPGTYHYEQVRRHVTPWDGQIHQQRYSERLVVSRPTATKHGLRQRLVRTVDEGEYEDSFYQLLLWDRGEVFEMEVGTPTHGLSCRYDPPVSLMQFPLEVGDRWRVQKPCFERGSITTVDNEVIRTERFRVGGTDVQTVVVSGRERWMTKNHETVWHYTRWWSPEHGLLIREVIEQEGAEQSKDTTSTLISLTPS